VIVGVLRETAPGERRVALVPEGVRTLAKAGLEVRVEAGAGAGASFADDEYEAAGARLEDAAAVRAAAALLLAVQPPSDALIEGLRPGSAVVSLLRPLDEPARAARLAARGLTAFSLELVPRITRAQAMDVLSSQATVAGYRAVVLAAERLPKMFPMLVTAAGTLCAADQPAPFLIAQPAERAVYQRNAENYARIPITGTYNGKADRIEARYINPEKKKAGKWQRITIDRANGSFDGRLKVPAGGWYRIEIRAAGAGKPAVAGLSRDCQAATARSVGPLPSARRFRAG
jgi:hypothetical protein